MLDDSTDSDNGISESDEISIEDEDSSPIPDWLQEAEIANVAESQVDSDIPDWILEVSDEQVEGDSGPEPEIANLDDSDDLIRPVVLYADPPYRNLDIMNRVFAGLKGNQTILPGSVLILEHEKGSTIPEDNTFNVIKEKKFGRSLLTMFEF